MYTRDADTTAIVDEIASPLVASLLSIHPNDVTLHDHQRPSQWSSWWDWASEHPQAWLQLVHYFMRDDVTVDAGDAQIPPQLSSLVDSVRSLQLQRTPSAYETHAAGDRSYRISPKKEHEVDRMSSYIRLMAHSESSRSVWHAVDVGSGQGYLSRSLQDLGFHVLALDNNEHQTSGANRWTTKEAARRAKRAHRSSYPSAESTAQEDAGAQRGSLAHRTVHVCPRTLEEAITDWLTDPPGIKKRNGHHSPTSPEPIPVTLVALHACGSLTVDVLRTFLSNRARVSQAKDAWIPHSLVVVGCCYNLMSPSGTPRIYLAIPSKYECAEIPDFPLSKPLRDMNPIPKLTIAAVHLAAQVPSQWLKTEDAMRGTELALRKVVYRALLQPVLQVVSSQFSAMPDHATSSDQPIQPGIGETLENRRLGKLIDKAYQDWPTFLERATDKLGIDLAGISASFPEWFTHEAVRLKMERALFVLQTLRCILGPLIETLILLDRRDWIREELAEMTDCGQEVEVEMVNLFDQSTGSGRNVALVAKPATVPHCNRTPGS